MSSANTPSEFRQPKNDEEIASRAKQDAEQAALPYVWKQTDIKWVGVEFTVPANLKSRDLVITFSKSSLKAGIKGQAPIIEVRRLVFSPRG